jgi:hypothetical protein
MPITQQVKSSLYFSYSTPPKKLLLSEYLIMQQDYNSCAKSELFHQGLLALFGQPDH